jgi:hypothetical protein
MNGGARKGAGRKKGIGVTNLIQKYCYEFITDILKEDLIKNKALKEIQTQLDFNEKKDFIYIIKNNNKYKIGYTSNFDRRLKNYKTHLGNVDLILLYESFNAFEIEEEIHLTKNKNKDVSSEWYELTETELIQMIKHITIKVHENG